MDVRVGPWRKLSRWRIDVFELWCWRRLLRVPWTARRSNQSILKEISPEYSLEGRLLKLKLQYFGHLKRRTNSLEKTLMLGKIEGRKEGEDRGWDGWMASPTSWTWIWLSSGSWWRTGKPGMLQSMGSQRARHDWATELNWIQLCQVLGAARGIFLVSHRVFHYRLSSCGAQASHCSVRALGIILQ